MASKSKETTMVTITVPIPTDLYQEIVERAKTANRPFWEIASLLLRVALLDPNDDLVDSGLLKFDGDQYD